ncbi:glycosyltransferase family 9 protein [Alcanivorax sp.]|uniref:glycosyltransferase family 9 protein n=1 Tax=Alcanivorax sp. TaxID=1872427 RepID=UPI00258A67AD|nr:glycosyltransferase family 9 protein [Alcanivorax sp.]
MKVDTMRRIDRWLGVPLCFLFTPWVRLFSPRRPSHPKRALFIELSEMGSAILADPAMRKLRDQGVELHFVIFAKNRPSLDLLGTVPKENVFVLHEDSLMALAADSLRFLAWCRRRRIDTVIDLELFSRFTALLTGLSGAAIRCGFYRFHNEGLYRGQLLTHRVAYNPHQHIARNFVALVNAVLSEDEELPYSKTLIGEHEIELARAKIDESARVKVQHAIQRLAADWTPRQPLVLINANASDLLPQRRWDGDNYARLAALIAQARPDCLILFTGSPEEREGLQRIVDKSGVPNCINFAGEISFELLPALYDQALLMVSNDSGPPHFASVTRLRSFVLFGPETPALYGPLGGRSTPIFLGLACSPCVSAANHRKTPCRDNACLQGITPQQVFDTLRPCLMENDR